MLQTISIQLLTFGGIILYVKIKAILILYPKKYLPKNKKKHQNKLTHSSLRLESKIFYE